MQVEDLKPEADDPLYKAGEGSLVRQLGAECSRLRARDDLAVVELRTQRSASRAAETDLIYEWSHWEYASPSVVNDGASVSGGRSRRRHPESGDLIVGPDGMPRLPQRGYGVPGPPEARGIDDVDMAILSCCLAYYRSSVRTGLLLSLTAKPGVLRYGRPRHDAASDSDG